MIPISWYIVFSALLFSIGLFGVLGRRNLIVMMMGIELMLNAVLVNIVVFWRYGATQQMDGLAFALVAFAAAAAEVAAGLAIIISVYRRQKTTSADEINLMKW